MNNSIIDSVVKKYSNKYFDDIISDFIYRNKTINNNIVKALKSIRINIEESSRIAAEISLNLGFYPCNSIELLCEDFLKLKDENKQTEYICNKIKTILKKEYIRDISDFFEKPKILSLYYDYNNKKYDDCILKIIVIINNIFNDKLGSISAEETEEVYRKINYRLTGFPLPKVKTKNGTEDKYKNKIEKYYKETGFEKYAYYIFCPYYYVLKKDNMIFKSYYNNSYKERKKLYKSIPYNRNAIIHGYVEDYGTEENCLRWFSVLINTYELFSLFEELIKYE